MKRHLALAPALLVVSSACSLAPQYQTPFAVENPLLKQIPLEKPAPASAPTHGEAAPKPPPPKTLDTRFEQGKRFAESFVKARSTNTDSADIRAFMSAGISYSQSLCHDYFTRLSSTKAHRDFAAKSTNLAGGLTSALMGLTKVASAQVAATGALFSFGEAAFDAYEDAFLVTPNVASLEQLVKRKQREEEIVIYRKLNAPTSQRWPDRIEDIDQAERSLNDYIFHCTVNGMRSLLETSIQQRTLSIETGNQDAQQAGKAKPASQLPRK